MMHTRLRQLLQQYLEHQDPTELEDFFEEVQQQTLDHTTPPNIDSSESSLNQQHQEKMLMMNIKS